MQKPEIVIVVMGPTGTGKSTFINLLTKDKGIRIGHDLDSQTFDINMASYVMPDGRRVTFVDTPGFDDSREGVSDTDILDKIATFLQADGGRMVNGIIYLHRISDPKFGGTAKKNFRMFRELCGENSLRNVRIVTTYWSRVDKHEGSSRQKELEKGTFKPLIEGGAELMAHDGKLESAQAIVSELVQLSPIKLKIQQELDAGKVLADTSAGAVIMEEMKAIKKKQDREMEDLKKELEEAVTSNNEDLEAEIAEERRKLEKMMAQVEEDRKRMGLIRFAPPQPQTEGKKTVDKGKETSVGAGRANHGAEKGHKRTPGGPKHQGEPETGKVVASPPEVMGQLRVMQETHKKEMDELKTQIGMLLAQTKDVQAEVLDQGRRIGELEAQPQRKRGRWYLCGL